MKRHLVRLATVVATIALILNAPFANADDGQGHERESARPYTLAVYGDWPYSTALLNTAPNLINSINSDPRVRLVLHVGDIHSGSMPCTGAGLDPRPASADPAWNQTIYNLFQQFHDPVVYTPGDNEWTDCHKTKEGSSGAPLRELAAVRELFFAHPGRTLGRRPMEVRSQARQRESVNISDAQFVENVMWEQSQVVFVTINLPGSNNDTLPWNGGTGAYLDEAARQREVTERTAADIRWLQAAFEEAREEHARGVVIGLQANMWDPEALAPGGDGLSAYTPLVQELARLCNSFGRPVLLINGDSHVYEADQPLADPGSVTGVIHGAPAVPNLTRLTVEGSTAANEWLRLTVDPRTTQVFSWERIQYQP